MRLVTGCTLAYPEVEAISRGESLRDRVARHLVEVQQSLPEPLSSYPEQAMKGTFCSS